MAMNAGGQMLQGEAEDDRYNADVKRRQRNLNQDVDLGYSINQDMLPRSPGQVAGAVREQTTAGLQQVGQAQNQRIEDRQRDERNERDDRLADRMGREEVA